MKINYLSKSIRLALGLGAASLTVGMALVTPAQADSVQWNGNTSGDWTDGTNWDTAAPPQGGDDALVTDAAALPGIPPNTSVTYTNPGDLNPGSVANPLNSVVVDGVSTPMTLNQSTDNLSTGAFTVGDGGTGTFNQDSSGGNSTTNVSGNLILGNQATGNGTYTITGDTAQTNVNFVPGGNGGNPNGALIVGNAGTGSFTQGTNLSDNGNQVNVAGDLTLGHQSGSSGAYLLNSGTLTVGGQAAVGGQTGSNGTFTQNGGTLTLTNSASGDSNYASVPPGSGAWGGKLAVGGGVSSFGGNDGGSGTYTMTGGLINATANGIEVGPSGTGTMNQSGGTVNTTFLTEGFSGTGTYNLSGTGTINSYSESVGYAGTGTFNQSGGTHTIDSDLRVGAQYSTNSPGSGTYNLSSGVLNSGNTFVGQGETGSIVVTDPIALSSIHNVTGNLILGTLGLPDGVNPQPAGNGSYSITGSNSQLNVNFKSGGNGSGNPNGALIVGESGIGSFTQGVAHGTDTPSVNVAGDLVLGQETGSSGTYTQNGGTNAVSGDLTAGKEYGSSGKYTLSGDSSVTLGVSGTIVLGVTGYGEFDQSGGKVTASELDLGRNGTTPDPTGIYRLTGTGSLQVNNEIIGELGHGAFYQGDGSGNTTHTVTGALTIGDGARIYHDDINGTYYGAPGYLGSSLDSVPPGRSGSYTLTDGTLSTGSTVVGSQGYGTFDQTGGLHAVGGNLVIGQQYVPFERGCGDGSSGNPGCNVGGPATGIYTLNSGGTLTVGGNAVVGDAGNGTFNQNGGSNTVTGNVTVAQQAGSTGTYNLSGGSLAAASMNVNTGGTFNYSGGIFSLASGAGLLTNEGQVNLSGSGTRTVEGNVVNNGSFKVTDTNVTYTGSFTNNGAYHSDPSINIFNNLTVGTTGYLTGGLGDVFKMQGNFTNQSTQFALWQTSAATLEFTGTTHQMSTTGNFNWGSLILDAGASLELTGNLTVGLFDLMGGLSQLNALTGTFDIFYDSKLAGNAWLEGLNYTTAGGGLITAYNTSSSVPEPASLTLFGFGLAGLLFRRRRS